MVKITVELTQELIEYLQSCDDAHAEGLAEELSLILLQQQYPEPDHKDHRIQ